jgi:type IV pilus assembly protein PilE
MARRNFKVSALAGFTLIELMVTIVVAAILLSVAIPGYQTYIRKSRRTEARTAVLDLAGREEALFSTTNAYSATPADVGYTAFPSLVGSNYYTINVAVQPPAPGAPPSFLITAAPAAGSTQALDTACAGFTVDQVGNQKAVDSGGADNTQTCWGN